VHERVGRGVKGLYMNMLYNSSNFCVLEFSDFGDAQQHPAGGFEIMDKSMRREIFLDGAQAEQFKRDVDELMSTEPSFDDFDAFLSGYAGLMIQPLAMH
jgi:hypothetical protein